MQNDHLEDAILFIQSALGRLKDGYPVSRHNLERAIEEIEAFRQSQQNRNIDAKG